MNTPDLLGVLEEIETLARHTQRNLQAGLATSGASGLRKIEEKAQDARRHAVVNVERERIA